MILLFRENSFIIIALALTVGAGYMLLAHTPKWRDILAFGAIVAMLIFSWVFLHPTQTPLMEDAKQVQALIGAGTPVLLEFQSPY